MKHVFFDMDGTLTESRSEVDSTMASLLDKLVDRGDVVIVSGADMQQISKQMLDVFQRVAVLAQNGNDAMTREGKSVWRRKLDWVQKRVVFELIRKIIINEKLRTHNIEDLVEDRGSQISFSAIGHNAPREDKATFDPGGMRRREFLSRQHSISMLNNLHVKYAIGGTTCIDFYTHTKGENVKAYAELMGWSLEDCVYVGDALFDGGNDETVKGVIPTISVENPEGTKGVINHILETPA